MPLAKKKTPNRISPTTTPLTRRGPHPLFKTMARAFSRAVVSADAKTATIGEFRTRRSGASRGNGNSALCAVNAIRRATQLHFRFGRRFGH